MQQCVRDIREALWRLRERDAKYFSLKLHNRRYMHFVRVPHHFAYFRVYDALHAITIILITSIYRSILKIASQNFPVYTISVAVHKLRFSNRHLREESAVICVFPIFTWNGAFIRPMHLESGEAFSMCVAFIFESIKVERGRGGGGDRFT